MPEPNERGPNEPEPDEREPHEPDANAVFLAEVARLVPDATVVAVPPPPPPPTDVPEPEVARDLAARLAAYAVAELAAVWRLALPDSEPPDEVRQRFIAEHHAAVLRVEAAARRPFEESLRARLAAGEAALRDAGWTVTATTRGSGAVTVAGSRGDLRLNLVAAPADGVLAGRVVTGQLTVGELGTELLASSASLPWPGGE